MPPKISENWINRGIYGPLSSLHRIFIARLWISQWIDTLERWNEVVALSQKHDVMSTTGWDFGMISFSISLVALELGRSEESQKWFRIGRNNLRHQRPLLDKRYEYLLA